MNDFKFDPETIFHPIVKTDLIEFAEWLVPRGYTVCGVDDDSWAEDFPIGRNGYQPFFARQHLKDDFSILVSLSGIAGPGKPISGLKDLAVQSIYGLRLSIWFKSCEKWQGAQDAAAFVEKAEPIARRQATRQSMRRCPKCQVFSDGPNARGILERIDGARGWECWIHGCKFKWGRDEAPLSLVSRGRARFQFSHKCKECKQPMVWFAGSKVLRCSLSPRCKFTMSAPRALAERLMKA